MVEYYFGHDGLHNISPFDRPAKWGGPGPVDFNFHDLAKQLDCSRNFNRVGIIYSNGVSQWLVRPSRRIANSAQSIASHVIVTKVCDISQEGSTKAIVKTLQAPSLATEITSTALSCGAAVITLALALTGTAILPITAGASVLVAGVIAASGVATVGQCFIGAGRLWTISRGREERLAWLDSQDWYLTTTTILDIISLAGAGAGLAKSIEVWKTMKKISSAEALSWLRGLSRFERKRLTYEIIRNENPGIPNSGIKAAIEMGRYPKRFPSEALQRTLQRELMQVIVNSSAFAGSGISGTVRNPHNLKKTGQYVIGIIQSFSLT